MKPTASGFCSQFLRPGGPGLLRSKLRSGPATPVGEARQVEVEGIPCHNPLEILKGLENVPTMFHITTLKRGDFISNRYDWWLVMWVPNPQEGTSIPTPVRWEKYLHMWNQQSVELMGLRGWYGSIVRSDSAICARDTMTVFFAKFCDVWVYQFNTLLRCDGIWKDCSVVKQHKFKNDAFLQIYIYIYITINFMYQ